MKFIAILAAAGCVAGLVVSNSALAQSMTSNEVKATSISKKWRGTPGMVTIGPDGKVIFAHEGSDPMAHVQQTLQAVQAWKARQKP